MFAAIRVALRSGNGQATLTHTTPNPVMGKLSSNVTDEAILKTYRIGSLNPTLVGSALDILVTNFVVSQKMGGY